MRRTLVLLMVVVGVATVEVSCASSGDDSSSPTGPSYVPAPTAPAPQPTFQRYVAVALSGGLNPTPAWGIAYGSSLQGTRNAAIDFCQRGGSSCEIKAECNPPIGWEPNANAALAMTEFSSTFPIGRYIGLACGGPSVAEVEYRALVQFCSAHPKTGACRIYWSGSLR
jgi:hypothetical protein